MDKKSLLEDIMYKQLFYHTIDLLQKAVISYYQDRLCSLVVFGSVAKDCFSPESDVDVLLVLETMTTRYETYTEFFEQVETKLPKGIQISPIFKSKETLTARNRWLWNNQFLILYDKDRYFEHFLEELHNFEKDHIRYHKKPIPYFEIV